MQRVLPTTESSNISSGMQIPSRVYSRAIPMIGSQAQADNLPIGPDFQMEKTATVNLFFPSLTCANKIPFLVF